MISEYIATRLLLLPAAGRFDAFRPGGGGLRTNRTSRTGSTIFQIARKYFLLPWQSGQMQPRVARLAAPLTVSRRFESDRERHLTKRLS